MLNFKVVYINRSSGYPWVVIALPRHQIYSSTFTHPGVLPITKIFSKYLVNLNIVADILIIDDLIIS